MKKKLIINLIGTILVLAIVCTAIAYAWYTNTSKSSSIKYVSNGTILAYTIDDSDEINEESYEVTGVTFFDVDSKNEGYYFTDMAVCLKLNVKNYSKNAVKLTVEGESQSYTLTASVADNVVTIYKYEGLSNRPTRSNFSSYSNLYTYTFDSTAGKYVYTAASAYAAGATYYQRSVLTTVTLTAAAGKITEAEGEDDSYVVSILNSDKEIAVEKYVAVNRVDLTADIFNAGNSGFYYTLDVVDGKNVYTHAKEYNSSTQYYELQTQAYLSDLTINGTTVSAVGSAVSGAYITCAISETELDSKTNTYVAVDTTNFTTSTDVSNYYVLNSGKYVAATGNYVSGTTYYRRKPVFNNSVNDFLSTNCSNRYVTGTDLTGITVVESTTGTVTSMTPGGDVTLFIYIYGVQPYDNAKNNFLNNELNVYPFTLIISAE